MIARWSSVYACYGSLSIINAPVGDTHGTAPGRVSWSPMLEPMHRCYARHDAEAIVHSGRLAVTRLVLHTGLCRCLASLCYDGRHVFVCLRQSPREKVTMAQQSDVIARARALHELVHAEAPRTESQRTLTAPVVQALLDLSLIHI